MWWAYSMILVRREASMFADALQSRSTGCAGHDNFRPSVSWRAGPVLRAVRTSQDSIAPLQCAFMDRSERVCCRLIEAIIFFSHIIAPIFNTTNFILDSEIVLQPHLQFLAGVFIRIVFFNSL